jgi:Flp pilus assembly protein TadG
MEREVNATSNQSKRKGGQSAVEFAILLPLLMLILFGVLDLGRVFFAAITITNAARAGARYATQYPSDTNGIKATALAEAQGQGIVLTDPNSVSVTCPQGCGSNQSIQVTVTYSVTLIMGFVLPSPVPVSNSVQMLVP